MERLKVIHISRGFEDYVLGLINSLPTYVDLHVVLCSTDEWMSDEIDKDVKIFRSNAPRVSSAGNIFSLFRLIRYISNEKPDVIHMQNGVIWEAILPIIFPSIPFIVTVHDVTQHPSRHRIAYTPQGIQDYLVSKCDSIIVHGDRLRRYATEYYSGKVKLEDIHVVPHGVIERYGNGRGRIRAFGRVLFFGCLDTCKGIEYLVRAEPIIREAIPWVEIRIAGKSSDQEYYKSLIKQGQKIHLYLERQSHEQVNELFLWADILVLPYIEASQSGVLSLGVNYSLPPIVTNVGGLPDVVENEINGLIVEPGDANSLAEAVIRLLIDESLREDIIKNLDSCKNGTHGRSAIARKTVDIYQHTVNMRRRNDLAV